MRGLAFFVLFWPMWPEGGKLAGLPRLGKIPSPLEVVDGAADIVNQVFSAPNRIASNVGTAVAKANENLERDIAAPRLSRETPKAPGTLIQPAFSGIGHIVGGAVDAVKGGLDGVAETFEGIKADMDARLR